MFNYDVIDESGKKLGVISLETEELGQGLMHGMHYELGVSWLGPTKQILAFAVVPIEAQEAMKEPEVKKSANPYRVDL